MPASVARDSTGLAQESGWISPADNVSKCSDYSLDIGAHHTVMRTMTLSCAPWNRRGGMHSMSRPGQCVWQQQYDNCLRATILHSIILSTACMEQNHTCKSLLRERPHDTSSHAINFVNGACRLCADETSMTWSLPHLTGCNAFCSVAA